LSLFPGVSSLIKPQNPSDSWKFWFPILLIFTFQVGDLIGRTVPKWFLMNFKLLTPLNFCRIVFFPLFILSVESEFKPEIFLIKSNILPFVFMIVFSISNGYLGTIAMVSGPTHVDDHERETAGTIMSFWLNFGLAAGTWTGLVINYFVSNTWPWQQNS